MANFCIPPQLAEKLKTAVTSNLEVFRNSSSEQRREFFTKLSDPETARQINVSFEKALISNQKNALKNWANRNLSSAEKKAGKFQLINEQIDKIDKIFRPDEMDNFLEDLASEKLGVKVTADQAKNIADKSQKLKETINLLNNELGNPTAKIEEQKAYAKAKEDIDNYVKSLTPESNIRVATSVIGRSMMLARLGSVAVNVISNTVQGLKQGIDRRIASRSFAGSNSDLIKNYINNNVRIFVDSGLDLSRMLSMNVNPLVKGERITSTQGTGFIKKLGRVAERYIFRYTQGTPDVAFAAFSFADRANISSTKIALKEGFKGEQAKQRAREIMIDAMRVEPQTKIGKLVRDESIADAMYSTGTQDSAISKAALKLRDSLNSVSKDLSLGDLNIPFVKTPANFIQIGIENTGVLTVPSAAIRLWKTIQIAKETGMKKAFLENFQGYGTEIVRSGTGILFAVALAEIFAPKDFIGAYPTNQTERDLLASKQATVNSVKIGNTWVSLDYFGPLKSVLTGYFYQKKYGGTLGDRVVNYIKGIGVGAADIPGLQEIADTYDKINTAPDGKKGLDQLSHDAGYYFLNFIQSRAIPGFVTDFGRVLDPYEREKPKTDVFAGIKATFDRESLPIAKNVFGEDIPSQGFIQFFFGSRVKSGEGNLILDELTRLQNNGMLPSINNVEKRSQRAKDLRQQIGETEFRKALEYYGRNLKSEMNDLIQTNDYKELTDEEKKKELNDIQDEWFADMLETYGYEKPVK